MYIHKSNKAHVPHEKQHDRKYNNNSNNNNNMLHMFASMS